MSSISATCSISTCFFLSGLLHREWSLPPWPPLPCVNALWQTWLLQSVCIAVEFPTFLRPCLLSLLWLPFPLSQFAPKAFLLLLVEGRSIWSLVGTPPTFLSYHLSGGLIVFRDMLSLNFHNDAPILLLFCSVHFCMFYFLQYFSEVLFFPLISVWLSYTPESEQMKPILICSHCHQDSFCSCSRLHCGD